MPILALGAALSGALPVVSGVGAARAARATRALYPPPLPAGAGTPPGPDRDRPRVEAGRGRALRTGDRCFHRDPGCHGRRVAVSAGVWVRFALVMLLRLVTLSTLGDARRRTAAVERPRSRVHRQDHLPAGSANA
jgi:hypothetical protein